MKHSSVRKELVWVSYAALLVTSTYGQNSPGFKYVNPLIGSANGG